MPAASMDATASLACLVGLMKPQLAADARASLPNLSLVLLTVAR